MPGDVKTAFLNELRHRFGAIQKLPNSQSLFYLGNSAALVYVRYSKPHPGGRTFYGLRAGDLRQLEGRPSVICFLWDGQNQPLSVPYSDYEEVFHAVTPATDGQYKVQVYLQGGNTELYIAQAGRFNVEGNLGWEALESALGTDFTNIPELSHAQVQTLLGAIGLSKGHDVWIPVCDRQRLDCTLAPSFVCSPSLPPGFESVERILQEVDVIWIARGAPEPTALFEVEHSTPIYSGLLRFNDVHLTAPRIRPRFSIVANDARRDVFVKQLSRPTFLSSGLFELCTFLDYANVYTWFQRVATRSDAK